MAKVLTVFVAFLVSGGIASANPASRVLTIEHAQKGCHVWRDGSRQGTSMTVTLRHGQSLRISDRDRASHGIALVQFAGPKLAIRGHLMRGETQLITFAHPGLYRLKTNVIEMVAAASGKTPTVMNTLRLSVSVH
jgi:hypothetical protein